MALPLNKPTSRSWLPFQSRTVEDLVAHVVSATQARVSANVDQSASAASDDLNTQRLNALDALKNVNVQDQPASQIVETVFEFYAASGHWLDDARPESLSGPGSSLHYTSEFRRRFERFLAASNCRSLLDAPCGDFNWMREVRLPDGMRYFGGEISQTLTLANRRAYGSADRLFFPINLISEPLPQADIWLCRDCLFHLSFDHIAAVLRNAARANFKYCLLSSHCNKINHEIVTGEFREVNLLKAPFHFPEPIARLPDYIDGFPERYVGVWAADQLLCALTVNDI